MTTRRLIPAVLAFVALAGCSSEPKREPVAAAAASPKPETVQVTLPAKLIGLDVVREDIGGNIERIKETYFDSIGLFSFRDEKLLRATLQVSRFNDEAPLDRPGFKRQIKDKIGSTVPEDLRVGKMTVHLAAGNEQLIFGWFKGRSFYVLSVRKDYPFPRTLLRKLVEMDISE